MVLLLVEGGEGGGRCSTVSGVHAFAMTHLQGELYLLSLSSQPAQPWHAVHDSQSVI